MTEYRTESAWTAYNRAKAQTIKALDAKLKEIDEKAQGERAAALLAYQADILRGNQEYDRELDRLALESLAEMAYFRREIEQKKNE
jgi:hypothetical protein